MENCTDLFGFLFGQLPKTRIDRLFFFGDEKMKRQTENSGSRELASSTRCHVLGKMGNRESGKLSPLVFAALALDGLLVFGRSRFTFHSSFHRFSTMARGQKVLKNRAAAKVSRKRHFKLIQIKPT